MSEVVTAPPAAPAPAFRDRTAGLVVFGVIQVLIGVFCALMVLAVAVSSELAAQRGGAPLPRNVVAGNLVVYGLLAAYFLSTGIGSIRRRRWARALSLVFSWMWLIFGLLAMAMSIVLLPKLSIVVPPSQSGTFTAILLTVMAIFYVALPLVLVLFYRSPHVLATVEAHDPRVRWTDRSPLRVLGVSLLLAFAAISTLAGAAYATVPIAGSIITGAPATMIMLAFAGLFGFLSVQLYRLKKSAWWTLVLLQIVGVVIGTLTFLRTDFDKLYEAMGLMTPQMRAMALGEIYRAPLFWIITAAFWIAAFAYVWTLRRYFEGDGPRTRASDPAVLVT